MIESDPVWAHPVHPSTRDQPPPTITHHHQIILTTWHLSIPHHSINTGHYCRECISIALKIHVNKSCWTLPLIASLHAKSTFQWYFCTSKCKTNVLTEVGKYLIICAMSSKIELIICVLECSRFEIKNREDWNFYILTKYDLDLLWFVWNFRILWIV